MDTPRQRNVEGFAVVVAPNVVHQLRSALEQMMFLDSDRRIQKLSSNHVAIPITNDAAKTLSKNDLSLQADIGDICYMPLPRSKKVTHITPHANLLRSLKMLLEDKGIMWTVEIEKDVATIWERHNDLVLLPQDSFRLSVWKVVDDEVWRTVAKALGVTRVGRRGRVHDDHFRSAHVCLLLGEDGWVRHIDNSIVYCYDVTRCMFSSGNITEKLRVASFDCHNEVVVDMYAGIGYFTLPYLVHAGARQVYACEWNSVAVDALHRNLAINHVAHKCVVYHGDNRQVCPKGVADRVNLGLIPSSEDGWPTACAALKSHTGGVLHIHANVASYHGNTTPCDHNCTRIIKDRSVVVPTLPGGQTMNYLATDNSSSNKVHTESHNILNNMKSSSISRRHAVTAEWMSWARSTANKIKTILETQRASDWTTTILHVERVKSYAPHIDHVVLDLECRPTNISS